MNKKSELQIMESALTVFFIIVILAISLVFGYGMYSNYKLQELKLLRQEASFKMTQLVSSMPEIICSKANNLNPNCLDIDKIKSININEYFDYFGYSQITMHSIYPTKKDIIIYDKELNNYQVVTSSVTPIQIYNSTDNDVEGAYYFGYLQVKNYYN